jgi:hypothetical protein
MRDPGTPGRNPFFDHGEDQGPGDEASSDRPHDGAAFAGPPVDTSALGTLVGLVDALGQAQPEAGEHLLAAAHELVLAVKTVVDATEAVLAEQRAALHERNAAAGGTADSSDGEAAQETRPAGVYRIDLA